MRVPALLTNLPTRSQAPARRLSDPPPPDDGRSGLARRFSAFLAVALVALGAVLVHDSPAAQAGTAAALGDEDRALMIGTLTVADGGGWRGYRRSPSVGQLTDSSFSYRGTSYAVNRLVEHNASNFLILVLDKAIPASVKSGLSLHIADRRFDLADGEINPNDSKEIRWANSGEGWTAGDKLHISVTYTDYWSATLTVRDMSSEFLGVGCDDSSSTTANKCSTSATLSDNSITLRGTTHTISRITIDGNGLTVAFASPGAYNVLNPYKLYLGGAALHGSDSTTHGGTASNARWASHGLSWSAGDTVELRLTKSKFTGVTFRELSIPGLPVTEIDEVRVPEDIAYQVEVVLPRDPGSGNTVTVVLSRASFGCGGCGHGHGDRETITILSNSSDTDSNPETVTLKFTGGTSGNWDTVQYLDVLGVVDADGAHEHALVLATVSTSSTNQHDWYNQIDGAAGLYVTVTETGDDGTHGGVGGLATEGDLGGLKDPGGGEPEATAPPAGPRNVRVVPGDGRLTVSWDVGPREGVADRDIRHALRWTQTPGRWTNTHFSHVSASDGQVVYGGRSSYVITGLGNGVAANVEIRAFTGGDHYEGADTSSEWVKIKGPQTTPNSPPRVSSPIADVGPLVVGGDVTVDLSGVFVDSDGDTLRFAVDSTDDFVSVALIRYAPAPEAWVLAMGRGTANLTVTAEDGNGGVVSDTFTVTVKEAPTVANPIADIASLDAGTAKLISLSDVFADADGDTLTLSAASSDTDVATVLSQLDPVTGSATAITVTGVSSGTATVTVTAQDSDGNTVADTFDVTVPAAQQQAQQQAQYQGGSSDNDSPDDGDGDALPDDFDPPTDEHALEEPVVLIPGAIHNLTLTATGNGGVRVSWNAPTIGSAPTRYIVHLRPEGGKAGSGKTKRPKASKTQVTFNKLEPGTTYQVWVRAHNALGKGERTHATITLPTP